jgi:hypothetical protein
MDKTYKKIDNYTIEVTKQLPTPKPAITNYDRKFIEQQIINIQAQKDGYDAERDKELDECNAILNEMIKLRITKKSEEVTP